MTFGEILDLYLKGCGRTPEAQAERWAHLNDAYRKVCAQLELAELHVPNAEVTVPANQDFVDMDCDVYSIDWVFSKNIQRRCEPEEAGMRGRARFLDENGKPFSGHIYRYARAGNRLWFRDLDDVETNLLISFRFHPPKIDDSQFDKHPITPPQYDMAIVRWGIGNYFMIHPPERDGQTLFDHGQQIIQRAQQDLALPKSQKAEENKDRRHMIRQPGYDFSLWGR